MTVPMRVAPISLEAKYGSPLGDRMLKEDIRAIYHLLTVQGLDSRYLDPDLMTLIEQATFPLVKKTVDYSMAIDDLTVVVDASSAAVTITLPAADIADERRYVIKKIDTTTNKVVVAGAGSDTIDDSSTMILTAKYDAITVQSDKTEWHIL